MLKQLQKVVVTDEEAYKTYKKAYPHSFMFVVDICEEKSIKIEKFLH